VSSKIEEQPREAAVTAEVAMHLALVDVVTAPPKDAPWTRLQRRRQELLDCNREEERAAILSAARAEPQGGSPKGCRRRSRLSSVGDWVSKAFCGARASSAGFSDVTSRAGEGAACGSDRRSARLSLRRDEIRRGASVDLCGSGRGSCGASPVAETRPLSLSAGRSRLSVRRSSSTYGRSSRKRSSAYEVEPPSGGQASPAAPSSSKPQAVRWALAPVLHKAGGRAAADGKAAAGRKGEGARDPAAEVEVVVESASSSDSLDAPVFTPLDPEERTQARLERISQSGRRRSSVVARAFAAGKHFFTRRTSEEAALQGGKPDRPSRNVDRTAVSETGGDKGGQRAPCGGSTTPASGTSPATSATTSAGASTQGPPRGQAAAARCGRRARGQGGAARGAAEMKEVPIPRSGPRYMDWYHAKCEGTTALERRQATLVPSAERARQRAQHMPKASAPCSKWGAGGAVGRPRPEHALASAQQPRVPGIPPPSTRG